MSQLLSVLTTKIRTSGIRDGDQTESVMSDQDSELDQQDIKEQSIEDLDASDDQAATVVGGAMMIDDTASTNLMG